MTYTITVGLNIDSVDFTGNDLLELYLFKKFGVEQLTRRMMAYGPTFSDGLVDYMKFLLRCPDYRVKVVKNETSCPFCSPVTRMCGNGLPDGKLRSHSSTIEKLGLEEGEYTVSSLVEAVDSFFIEKHELPV